MDKLEYIRFLTGDVVYIHGSIRVISNCDGYYATYYDEDETLQEVNVNVIEGIPLTPEILEKNGWNQEVMSRGVKNSHWVYTKTDIEEYGYFPIYIEKGIGKEFDVYPFTDNHDCKQIAYIKYVHQLQHLLFGLGLNSEMEV